MGSCAGVGGGALRIGRIAQYRQDCSSNRKNDPAWNCARRALEDQEASQLPRSIPSGKGPNTGSMRICKVQFGTPRERSRYLSRSMRSMPVKSPALSLQK
jgi:hypothetical protein